MFYMIKDLDKCASKEATCFLESYCKLKMNESLCK